MGGPGNERLISNRPRLPSGIPLGLAGDPCVYRPLGVADDAGGAVVAWKEREKWDGDPDKEHIFAERIDTNGNSLWVVDIQASVGEWENIVVDVVRGLTPTGEPAVWVVYKTREVVACCTQGITRILAQRIDDNGGIISPSPIVIRDHITPPWAKNAWAERVMVIGDGMGGIIVVWRNFEVVETLSSALSSTSSLLSNPFSLTGNEALDEILKMDFYTVAGKVKELMDEAHNNPGVTTQTIYGQWIDVSGARRWAEAIPNYGMPIVYNRGHDIIDFGIIPGPFNNGIFIGWIESDISPNLFIQWVDSSGTVRYNAFPEWQLYGKPFVFNEPARGIQLSLANVDDRNAIITWTDLRGSTETTYDADVYVQKVDMTTGNPLWPTPDMPVSQHLTQWDGLHGLSLVAEDGAGGAFIMWHDIYPPGLTPTIGEVLDTADISFAHINSQGVFNISDFTQGIPSGQGLGDIIYDGNGGAIASWSDNRLGSFTMGNYMVDLYVQRILPLVVTPLVPRIISVHLPTPVRNDNRYPVTIEGRNFAYGASVVFINRQTGYTLTCYNVEVSADGRNITCDLAIFRADTGVYDLTVINPGGGSDTYNSAFNLLESDAKPHIEKDVRYNADAQTLTYFVHFGNLGGTPITDFEVRETIPPGTTLISYTAPPIVTCTSTPTELECKPSLPPRSKLDPYTDYLLTVVIDISALVPPVTIDNVASLRFFTEWIHDPESFTIYPPYHDGGGWCLFCGFSYDPNEKQVSPMDFVTVDTTLTFHIYFENIGTAPAKDVFITDTLSPLLDEYTLRDISDGGVYDPSTRTIRWELRDIYLQPHQSGFVSFRIMPRRDTPRGTIIQNKATVVFDVNPPIDTPVVNIYIGPPPEWDALYILEMVRKWLIDAKKSTEEDPNSPFYNLKNKGSIIAKLNSAIINITNAIDNLKENQGEVAKNNIDASINELNSLKNFISSQKGKTISTSLAMMGYYYIDRIVFLLEIAKFLI